MTTETTTTTREERADYLSEIRSAREAYLHPAGEGADRDVERMRAALRLMVLLRRAPDVEASMRGRQQLIVPAWDEGRWQGDVSRLIDGVVGIAKHGDSVARIVRQSFSDDGPLRAPSLLPNQLNWLVRIIRTSGLLAWPSKTVEQALPNGGIPPAERLAKIVGAHDSPPAMWWLDVCALIDDATGGEVDARQISRGVEAVLAARRQDVTAAAGGGGGMMSVADAASVAYGVAQSMGERDPARYEARAEREVEDARRRMAEAVFAAAGELPPAAVRLRDHLTERARSGLMGLSVPLIAPARVIDPDTGAEAVVRNMTLRIERREFGVSRPRTAEEVVSEVCDLVRRDLQGAMILVMDLHEAAGRISTVLTYIPADDVAELARRMGEG